MIWLKWHCGIIESETESGTSTRIRPFKDLFLNHKRDIIEAHCFGVEAEDQRKKEKTSISRSITETVKVMLFFEEKCESSGNAELIQRFNFLKDPDFPMINDFLTCQERASSCWTLFWTTYEQFFADQDRRVAEPANQDEGEDEAAVEPPAPKRRRHDLTRCGIRTFYEKYLVGRRNGSA
jgi:hypothetical protein